MDCLDTLGRQVPLEYFTDPVKGTRMGIDPNGAICQIFPTLNTRSCSSKECVLVASIGLADGKDASLVSLDRTLDSTPLTHLVDVELLLFEKRFLDPMSDFHWFKCLTDRVGLYPLHVQPLGRKDPFFIGDSAGKAS
jgi:hypothetical protein